MLLPFPLELAETRSMQCGVDSGNIHLTRQIQTYKTTLRSILSLSRISVEQDLVLLVFARRGR
jgi:hypothetical protein